METDGAYSNLILNTFLTKSSLSAEDKALCSQIFYGTLDRLITTDYILKCFLKTPLKKVKPYTLSVLRSGVYQIKFTDRIPASAAVNEAVKLIKNSDESYNAGFVNGVLRNVARTPVELPTGNDIHSLSVRYSCPAWLVSLLIRDYGAQITADFLADSLSVPPVYIRVNTRKTTSDALAQSLRQQGIVATDAGQNALVLSRLPGIETLSEYQQGLFHVEDLSCQKAIEALEIGQTDQVLDLCAAPGGKTFTAALIAQDGNVVACDLYEHRTGLIQQGADRLGLDNITVKTADATVYDESLGFFDRIICDVPCSGFGVIRRKPDIKYKPCSPLSELIDIQKQILQNAGRYLKPGGKLLYSTCTLHKAENEENVAEFLKAHTDFTLSYEHTFLPHTDGTDGFYAAVLIRE